MHPRANIISTLLIRQNLGDKRNFSGVLFRLAQLARKDEQFERVAVMLAFSEALRESVNVDLTSADREEYDCETALAPEKLGKEKFDAA